VGPLPGYMMQRKRGEVVSARLATDGLKILGVDNGSLRVLAWRAENKANIETRVDLLTGKEIP